MRSKLCIFSLTMVFSSLSVEARVRRDVLSRTRGEQRLAAQWTLTDWLRDENQISLWTSVLAFSRSTDWYEINVRGRAGRTVRPNGPSEDRRNLDFDAYLWLLNLHAEWERSSARREATGAGLGLRVLGISTRTTNLVVRYGWRHQRDDDLGPKALEWRFVEGEGQLYVSTWLGLEGGYRHYEPKGRRIEAGLFLEAQPVRFSAGYSREDLVGEIRETWTGGLKAFF